MEVTDEIAYDGKVMKQLIGQILKTKNPNKKIKIKLALTDGSYYYSNENFKYLQKKKIQPAAIKVRKNSVVLSKNNKLRNKEVILRQYFDRWKNKRKYGYIWMAETASSSIKRMVGEHTCDIMFQNMAKEMFLKVSLYNMFGRLS